MASMDETALRVLNDEELALVSGTRGIATTLALGEEDDSWCGGIVTTMAVGEEDPFNLGGSVALDANIHLRVSASLG